jgi:hypothetical protein
VLFSHKEEWNSVVCTKMDGTRGCAHQDKASSERQILYVFSHMLYRELNHENMI